MNVTVKLFADLREGRFKVSDSELADQSRITDVVEGLKIPPEQVAVCFVNGRDAETDYVIKNGDTVSLFPPVGGG